MGGRVWAVALLPLFFSCFLGAWAEPRVRTRLSGREFTSDAHSKEVICYWGTWSNYRPEAGKFTPEDIDPSLCTVLIYSFAGLDSNGSSIKSLDAWMDLETDYGLAGFRKATDLKYSRPGLRVTLAIGGWNEGSKKYSEMARDKGMRKKFVDSVVRFLEKYNFDGLDLDWEYPAKRGGVAADKQNFVLLIKDLREAFDRKSVSLERKWLLTAAIGAGAATIDAAYDVAAIYKLLDYVNVMCYDYHGKWDGRTGHNAPLYGDLKASGYIEFTWKYLLKKGAIPEKTNLGIPLYGRAFMLVNPHDNRMGAKSKSTAFQGPYTREDGYLGYNEICELIGNNNNIDNSNADGWAVKIDEFAKAPFMFRGQKWVSYDDEESVKTKARFTLLRSINHALYEREQGFTGTGVRPREAFWPLLLALPLAISRL